MISRPFRKFFNASNNPLPSFLNLEAMFQWPGINLILVNFWNWSWSADSSSFTPTLQLWRLQNQDILLYNTLGILAIGLRTEVHVSISNSYLCSISFCLSYQSLNICFQEPIGEYFSNCIGVLWQHYSSCLKVQ